MSSWSWWQVLLVSACSFVICFSNTVMSYLCRYKTIKKMACLTEKELREGDDDADDEDGGSALQGEPGCDVIESGDVGVLFLQRLKMTSDPSERTDFTNFRGLLWRAMALVPDRVEPRSRELSPLLLRFIRFVLHYTLHTTRDCSLTHYTALLF